MIAEPDNATIDTVVRILRKSRSVLFVTGAGMSVGSGMPTYRGIGGLYEVDTTAEGYEIEEIIFRLNAGGESVPDVEVSGGDW